MGRPLSTDVVRRQRDWNDESEPVVTGSGRFQVNTAAGSSGQPGDFRRQRISNSKFEIRNPKQIRMTKFKISEQPLNRKTAVSLAVLVRWFLQVLGWASCTPPEHW